MTSPAHGSSLNGRPLSQPVFAIFGSDLVRTIVHRTFSVLSTIGFVWSESNGLIVLAYLMGGVCLYFTAQSYATMAETLPTAGSVYGFMRHALGQVAGFVAGWMILLDYLLIPANETVQSRSIAVTLHLPGFRCPANGLNIAEYTCPSLSVNETIILSAGSSRKDPLPPKDSGPSGIRGISTDTV